MSDELRKRLRDKLREAFVSSSSGFHVSIVEGGLTPLPAIWWRTPRGSEGLGASVDEQWGLWVRHRWSVAL